MSKNILDLRQDTQYDLEIKKDRTLAATISCVYMSGDTEADFDFSSYSGATLEVKKDSRSSNTILEFSTLDSSIVLSTGNTFQLNKTAEELASLPVGEFEYDMYISSITYPKRAFLSGKFIITDRITT